MNRYQATLTHDKGTFKLKVTAQNEESARHMIKEAEGCPDCAIVKIVKLKN